MKKVSMLLALLAFTITLRAQNVNVRAQSIKIGTQQWMSKNLEVYFYRNGDTIPMVTDGTAWAALTTGAWCYYNNNAFEGIIKYGILYNWYAINDPRGLAPQGWHIPTDAEWTTLETTLGGSRVAGGKMKEAELYWHSPNTGATNNSGFTGLPGGHRSSDGAFYGVGNYGSWWSATESNTSTAWNRTLFYSDSLFYRNPNNKRFGFSVRCLRD